MAKTGRPTILYSARVKIAGRGFASAEQLADLNKRYNQEAKYRDDRDRDLKRWESLRDRDGGDGKGGDGKGGRGRGRGRYGGNRGDDGALQEGENKK